MEAHENMSDGDELRDPAENKINKWFRPNGQSMGPNSKESGIRNLDGPVAATFYENLMRKLSNHWSIEIFQTLNIWQKTLFY